MSGMKHKRKKIMTTALEQRRSKSIYKLCIISGGFFGFWFYLVFLFVLWIQDVTPVNYMLILLNFLCIGFVGGSVYSLIIGKMKK